MMTTPVPTMDIFLHQGDVYFGERDTQIRTLLGSCVAITMWHPQLLLGCMCHFLLPGRTPRAAQKRGAGCKTVLDGKYADEALALMLYRIAQSATQPSEYQIKVFGGGNMFPAVRGLGEDNVGQKNVEVVLRLLEQHKLKVCAEHVGGVGHRNLIFNIGSGDVWMRHQAPVSSVAGAGSEMREICLHV